MSMITYKTARCIMLKVFATIEIKSISLPKNWSEFDLDYLEIQKPYFSGLNSTLSIAGVRYCLFQWLT